MSAAGEVREPIRIRDPRRLLMERAAVLLGRVFRSVGRGFARWRKQAGRNFAAGNGGGLGAVMGRALAARGAHSRMLAVEERLALGPKQHLYLIRCGEQRLLVASAGEAALQWMTLPEEAGGREAETCGNTLFAEVKAVTSAKRSAASSGGRRRAVSRSGFARGKR